MLSFLRIVIFFYREHTEICFAHMHSYTFFFFSFLFYSVIHLVFLVILPSEWHLPNVFISLQFNLSQSFWMCFSICVWHLSAVHSNRNWKKRQLKRRELCFLQQPSTCVSKQELLSRVEDCLPFALWNWISSPLDSFDFFAAGKASYQHALPSQLLL